MTEMNITRRRTLQGVGAAGIAGIAGNTFVSVSSAQEAQQQDGAALRVAHASPDTPTVEVRVDEAGAGGVGAETPDGGGAGTPEDDGIGGDTPEGETPAGGGEPLVEGLGFREVSDYQEVEPGTYQVQVVATEETGLLEEIFGDEGEERVVFDGEVEVEEGTTYTAVAYGELAEADLGGAGAAGETPAGGQTPGGETPAVGQTPGGETPATDGGAAGGTTPAAGETPAGGEATGDGDVLVEGLAFGEAEYFEVDAGDHTLEFRESQAAGGDGLGGGTTPDDDGTTPGDDVGADGGTTPADTPGAEETPTDGATGTGGDGDTGFQVAVLEDELTVTGAGTAGDGAGVGDGTPEDDGIGGDDEGTPGGAGATPEEQETSRIRVFHAVPDVDAMDVVSVEGEDDGGLLGGDDGEETPAAGTPGEDTPEDDTGVGDGDTTPEDGGLDEEGGEDGAEQANISPEGGVVYSGFALGYFDPETAAGADEAGEAGTPAEEDDGGLLDGDDEEETPAGETPTGEETPEEGTPGEDEIVEDPQGEEFEFVTVEDARDGERADGGTGGLFS